MQKRINPIKCFLLIFFLPVLLINFFSNAYGMESETSFYEESLTKEDTESIAEESIETVEEIIETEESTMDENIQETDGEIQKKPLTSSAVYEILGGDYWLLSEEQLMLLDEAGYDVSGFYEIHEEDSGIAPFSYPSAYDSTKLSNKATLSWGTTMDDRLFMFGGNSYWNNGTYVQIYTVHRKGSYDGDLRDAYCLNPMVNSSSQGSVDAYVVNNDNLLKAFYYGFGGPGYSAEIANIYSQVDPYYSAFYHGSDEAYYVLTHCMAAMAHGDADWAYGLSQSAADTVLQLWNHIRQLPSPNQSKDICFVQSYGTTAFKNSNDLYECPTIYVEGSSNDYIEYDIPQNVTLYTGDGKAYNGGQFIKLYGGMSFCLVASEEAVQGTYKASCRGKMIRFRALVSFGNDLQDVGWMNKYIADGKETSFQVDWPEQYKVKITLTKKLQVDDINFDNGNPMFTFKLEGTERSGHKRTYHALVEFTKEYVNANKDGHGGVSASVVFEHLEPGEYIASEMVTSRYQLKNIVNITNGVRQGEKVRFSMTSSTNTEGFATFVNENYEQQDYSDAQKVINHLSSYE